MVIISEFSEESYRLHEIRLDGTLVRTLLEQSERIRPALDLKRGLVLGREGLRDLKTGTLTPLPRAKLYAYPEFVDGRPWVISPLESVSPTAPAEIEIFDYQKGRVVRTISGYWPSLGPAGELLFLRVGTDYIEVLRHDRGKERSLKRVPLDDHGTYEVGEVVALGGDRFLYRVSDEHEHRYYLANGDPFYPGDEGHYLDRKTGAYRQGTSKEQYDLVLSRDGAWAAFAERNWNELTYLVLVDRKAKRRTELPFYGSFPALQGGWLLFTSDPSFVRTEEPQFRQIERFVIYAYDLAAKQLCRVAVELTGDIAPYRP